MTHSLRTKCSRAYRRGGAFGYAAAFGPSRQDQRSPTRGERDHRVHCLPLFAALMALSVAAWIAGNLIAGMLRLRAIDGPTFPWLQGAANLLSMFVVMLVLVAQKHEDELNAHRDTLTLELAILSEHKIAKVIQLLEELRRDSPHVQDRVDRQADQMAQPADAVSVLAATHPNNAP